MEPEDAMMLALPTPTPEASPALLMVANDVGVELQVTALVRSCVLLSLYVPVAVNCWLVPFAIEGLAGVTDKESRIGGLTATLTEFVTVPEVALMLEVPCRLPITNPVALTGATAGEEDDHVAEVVRSCALPSV
jgi:hypothetical protein